MVVVSFLFFAYGPSFIPVPFIEKAIIFLLNFIGTFVKTQLTI